MLNWKYNPENYNAEGYQLVPPGEYRVRIDNAEEKVSSTNKPRVKLTLKVSGYNGHVWKYIVLDSSTPEAVQKTDNRLGRIFDSFGIEAGDMNLEDWKGKVGGVSIKNEPDDKGVMRASVSWFLRRDEQDKLPLWQEHPVGKVNPEMVDLEGDLPPF